MMRTKLKSSAFLIGGIFFGLTSCDGIGGESHYDLDKPGEIKEIKKEIIETVGDIPVYEIILTSKDELETSIDGVTLVTNDKANEGTLNRIVFELTGESSPTESVIDNDFFISLYLKNEPKTISDIDFDLVEKNFESAKKLIPSEYVDHALFEYTIEFENNIRADKFSINTIQKDENNHIEGNDLVTNYYEFKFEIDENANIIPIED